MSLNSFYIKRKGLIEKLKAIKINYQSKTDKAIDNVFSDNGRLHMLEEELDNRMMKGHPASKMGQLAIPDIWIIHKTFYLTIKEYEETIAELGNLLDSALIELDKKEREEIRMRAETKND